MNWKYFKKKPILIKAFQLTQSMLTSGELALIPEVKSVSLTKFKIMTLEGPVYAKVGDWVLEGVKQEKYPCRKDIFEETYEEHKPVLRRE